jgi:phage shock protein PspC (stress-responsive transcriptional regulator)
MHHPIPDPNPKLQEWHRGHPENRIAGVCTTIARQFDVPLPIVRSAFVVAALIPGLRGVSVLLYLAIWGLTPPAAGEDSTLDRTVETLGRLFDGADDARKPRALHDEFAELDADDNDPSLR